MNPSELILSHRVPYESLLKELTVLGKIFSGRALSFSMQAQTQSNWCWAATSVSVSHFYWTGSSWTQCRVAGGELGRTDCCNSPVPSPCNVPWYLDRALTRTNNFVSITGPIAFTQVQAEIDAGRPVGARVGWSGGGGHFMVIYGYRRVGRTVYLDIADPIYGNSSPTMTTFSSSYQGSGTWTHSYYTKSYRRFMPVDFVRLSDLVLSRIAENLPLLDLHAAAVTDAAASRQTSAGLAHHIFTLPLDNLRSKKAVPQLSGLRVLHLEKDQPRAFFDVDETTGEILQLSSNSPYISLVNRAIEQALTLVGEGNKTWQLRLLRVPALNVEAVWLHATEGDGDQIIPLRNFGGLTEFVPVPLTRAVTVMREASKGLAQMDDTMGS